METGHPTYHSTRRNELYLKIASKIECLREIMRVTAEVWINYGKRRMQREFRENFWQFTLIQAIYANAQCLLVTVAKVTVSNGNFAFSSRSVFDESIFALFTVSQFACYFENIHCAAYTCVSMATRAERQVEMETSSSKHNQRTKLLSLNEFVAYGNLFHDWH